jgi:hypothetical protein
MAPKNMKNFISLILLFILQACMIGAGENSKIEPLANNFFPKIVGIDLQGNKRQLPQAFDKKLNIVIVAFKREQQEEVDTWIPTIEEIIKKNSDVSFYEVPLIYELNPFSRAFVNNGMRNGIKNEIARQRTITVYTDREKFFEVMKMSEDKIYVLLLNNSGKILWQKEGVINKENSSALTKLTTIKNKKNR